jgi:hypothetical protein
MPAFGVLFESSSRGKWVGVLEDSQLVSGKIASQNAGSISPSMYYRVTGGGMNALFADPLMASGQLDDVNAELRRRYDACYGSGSWAKDAKGHPPRSDRLTTLLVELTGDGVHVGRDIAAMAYSVGPILGRAGIVDDAGYQQIYFDAMQAIDAWNQTTSDPIVGLRTTMVSCGIYATTVDDKDALFNGAAANIVTGIARAVSAYPALDGFSILVNTNDKASPPRERPAFTAAAKALGITVTADGFSVDAAAIGTAS